MANIVVLGAGTTGLLAAIALARRGHAISLVEKDPRPAPLAAADVFTAWHRRGTPQALLPHGLMAHARVLLRDRAPDLLAAIYNAGAIDFDMGAFVPGGARVPADDDLRVIFCRRPLIESVLWEAAAREPGLTLRAGTGARGLMVADGEEGSPRVCGVVTDAGEELRADLVVDATGRRAPVWAWLDDAGARLPAERIEACGLVYYSRYYALCDGASFPKGRWLWGPRAELPYALAIVHLADRGVFSITLGLPVAEQALRVVRHDAAFDAACAALPLFAPWVARETAEPISPVLAMGGLQNVLRAIVADGEPVATGVLPIGDALCHTNAAYGWGMAIGMAHAFALVDALAEHPEDRRALALAYHARVSAENEARWRVSTELDRVRTRAWQGDPASADEVPLATAIRELQAAAPLDARVFRAVSRFSTLLDPVGALLGDATLREVARAAVAAQSPAAPPLAASRDELLAVLAALVQED